MGEIEASQTFFWIVTEDRSVLLICIKIWVVSLDRVDCFGKNTFIFFKIYPSQGFTPFSCQKHFLLMGLIVASDVFEKTDDS